MTRLRFGLLIVSVAAVASVALRVASLQGLLIPVRIVGDSMAESLVGPHYRVDCPACGLPFRCSAAVLPTAGTAMCPNCGSETPLSRQRLRPGQRVLVDRWGWVWRSPVRWQQVALREPGQPSHFAVKRVVGLPGETCEISHGELTVEGRLVRKSLTQFRELAVLVHDDRYRRRGRAAAPSRWSAESEASAWVVAEGGYQFSGQGRDVQPDGYDWLTYHHRNWYRGPRGGAEGPVLDNDPYNQASSRQLHEVGDLQLSLRLEYGPETRIALRAKGNEDEFVVHITPGRRVQLLRNGVFLAESEPIFTNQEGSALVEYTLVDQQVLLALNGRVVLSRRTEGGAGPPLRTARPWAIGAAGGTVRVGELQVWRDIFYLPPQARRSVWRCQLAADEFLVLGDNCPVSRDSRHWQPPGLPRAEILGTVRPLH